MSIEERLKEYIIEKFGTLKNFSDSIGMPQSSLVTIMKRGVNASSVTSIIKICKALGISTDELAKGRIVPYEKNPPKDPQEIELTDLIKILNEKTDAYNLKVDNIPLDYFDYSILLNGIEMSLEMIRRDRERIKLSNKEDS